MTWNEYNEEVFKLVKAFGGALYTKEAVDKGWRLWKDLPKNKLADLVGNSIFTGKPIDLKTVAMSNQPIKQVRYYEHKEDPVDWDALERLKSKHGAASLWDLVLRYKKENLGF